MVRNVLKIVGFVLCSYFSFGQYQIGIIPRVSPDRSIYQKIGYTEVKIEYGSPSIRERKIWGNLVPYDQIWRAGANSATTFEINNDINIEGVKLDSGRYAVFIIPRENDQWTIILNSKWKQWGAFRHNPEQDVLKIDVSPRVLSEKQERLRYSIHQTGFNFGSIRLAWEFIEIELAFETNYLKLFENEVRNRAESQPMYIKWIPYLQGAEHLADIRGNLKLAKEWINYSEKIMLQQDEWNDQFYPRPYVEGHLLWTKAKILSWSGDRQGAVDYVERLKLMKDDSFYERNNDKLSIDKFYMEWTDQ